MVSAWLRAGNRLSKPAHWAYRKDLSPETRKKEPTWEGVCQAWVTVAV